MRVWVKEGGVQMLSKGRWSNVKDDTLKHAAAILLKYPINAYTISRRGESRISTCKTHQRPLHARLCVVRPVQTTRQLNSNVWPLFGPFVDPATIRNCSP
jgi:hypothetical protein